MFFLSEQVGLSEVIAVAKREFAVTAVIVFIWYGGHSH